MTVNNDRLLVFGTKTMFPHDVMDICEYARALRKRRVRWLGRVGVPVLCLLVMIGAIAGIVAYSYIQNRRDALVLSNDLIRFLDDRITAQVTTYLEPVSQMVRLAAAVLNDHTFDAVGRDRAEHFAIRILERYPQIVAFNVGDPTGSFLMVKRMPDGSLHTKTIQRSSDDTRVSWFRRDTAGNIIQVEHSTDDPFDPRVRPWFIGALEANDIYWSDVYIFFTDRKPGVTAALAVRGPKGQLQSVLGMDVLLEQLSTFLAGLSIGNSGKALIIDEKGRLVAMGQMDRMLKQEKGELRPLRLNELKDPALTRAYNRFRIEGHGSRQVMVGDQSVISIASPLRLTVGRDWSILIIVPENDFIGFVKQNAQSALILSTVFVAVTSLIVGFLAWQGLKADRHAQLILDNRQQFEMQSRAFSDTSNDLVLYGLEPIRPDIEAQAVQHETAPVEPAVVAVGRSHAGGQAPYSPGLITGGRTNRFYERLAERGLDRDRLGADVFGKATVFVLRFTDHLILVRPMVEHDRVTVMDHLVDHLEKLATAHGLDYLKVMSGEFIGATGFGNDCSRCVRDIADLTLELQDICRHVFADLDAPMDFRIGVDTGPVIGSTVGEKRNYYNLWGDAVQTAAMLAQVGVLGAIHVSESAYQHLRASYVFKKRGAFYLEETGEIRTYLLTGRL
jgi:class 3 adenylate cyclase